MTKQSSTILITGGTSGVGYACALNIAGQKPEYDIIIASRSNTGNAAESMNKKLHQTNVTYQHLDLSSLTQVRAFAATYATQTHPPISALILNAAIQYPNGVCYSADGVEKTFAVNHVGHSLLFYLLRPHLAPDARIIITTSGTHNPAKKTGLPDAKYTTAEELAHPPPAAQKNKGRQRYTTSKLCNVLWTYALHDHITKATTKKTSSRHWTVTTYCPGLVPGTGLAREAGPVLRFGFIRILPHLIWLLRLVYDPHIHSAPEAGAALARLAVGTDVEGVSARYFEGMTEKKSSSDSYVKEKQGDLWEWTAKFVAMNEEEVQSFSELSI